MAATTERVRRRPTGSGGPTVADRVRALERQGYRVTPQRRAILSAVLGAGRVNVTAEEICAGARTLCPTVNLATTYRTLDLLGRLGVVRRVTCGDARGVFCANPEPHYHGTCLRCGTVVDLPRGRVGQLLDRELARLTDAVFSVVDHRIEFYGYCDACRASARAAATS